MGGGNAANLLGNVHGSFTLPERAVSLLNTALMSFVYKQCTRAHQQSQFVVFFVCVSHLLHCLATSDSQFNQLFQNCKISLKISWELKHHAIIITGANRIHCFSTLWPSDPLLAFFVLFPWYSFQWKDWDIDYGYLGCIRGHVQRLGLAGPSIDAFYVPYSDKRK